MVRTDGVTMAAKQYADDVHANRIWAFPEL